MSELAPRVYNERNAVLLKLETTPGEDANPTPEDDAFLVGSLDIGLDPQELTRDIDRPSFSPTPGEVGRKVMSISFNHEIKGAGNASARPALGALLRSCGMKEILISAGASDQIENPVVAGTVIGPTLEWSKDAAPTARFGSYLVRVVTGGASGVAEMQVFRWNQSDMDETVLLNTRHAAETNFFAETTFTLNDSDETSLEFTVGGTVTEKDRLYAVVGGHVYSHRVTDTEAASTTAEDDVASALAAKIDAHPLLTAVAAGAVITVTFDGNAAPVEVTSGTTSIVLGDSGAEITPTWVGDLVKGQMWIVALYEEGYMYLPTSDEEEMSTATIYVFRDGQLYRMTASIGTVTFTGTAGEYGAAQFEFTGNYIQPTQEPLPSSLRYELSRPPKVELAQLSIHGDKDFCAESFTITLGNDVNERLCINAEDGYAGSEITDRETTLTVNPEGTLEVYKNMWGDFADGEEVPVHLRVGKTLNNMVRFYADLTTYSGMTLTDRNNRQVMEPTFRANGVSPNGDDELRVNFPISAA